ncbi:DUF4062 domain-containing protein [Mesorhizobium sp. B2-3-6]|nr:DUF4062 domain-containing protein [Mesorhizobium sp. B2-4-10]TPL10357.1 DUF4062 domain-containing protein [Mesorhizobium sp. B2-4-10]TPM12983.1 DUF4062 domain-containing protein [Mesorhizobium sp. B2-3-6]
MFRAHTLRVLIASPSDLLEERQMATDAINEWNVQHAAAESIVLLPVKWETHTTPHAGMRPQQVINEQIVQSSDVLIGMFWTKFGTHTGVAESGTVEEINQFVDAGKPTLLYFSQRPIDPGKIDIEQHNKLTEFKAETYKNALVGSFADLNSLYQILLRDLLRQVREMKVGRPMARPSKIEQAKKLTDLIVAHKEHNITPEMFNQYRDEFLGRRRTKGQMTDPVPLGEVGPNGHRVGYTKEGDKVEWLPDDENPGEEWPMILRRSDKSIFAALEEFADVVWYDRKLVLQQNLKDGSEKIDPEIEKGMLAAMKATEKKYGKRKLRNYYKDDFEWGMLNGKLSALRWVMGDDWDMLDT